MSALACGRLPSGIGVPPTVWTISDGSSGSDSTGISTALNRPLGALIVLDSLSFRPVSNAADKSSSNAQPQLRRDTRDPSPEGARVAVVTSFQGSRYHPETVRALAADAQALGATAGAVAGLARSMTANAVIIDLQAMTPNDIRGLVDVTRALTDSIRAYVLGPIGFVVPAADTAGYPGSLLARTANLIVVRLDGEHRPGTSPGAFASEEWLARHVGARAAEVGASRVVTELPLTGYRWSREGSASRITYQQALAAVLAEGTAFRRDPASRALQAASAREGWEIWINDGGTIEFLIASARRIGVNRFLLTGVDGADPELDRLLQQLTPPSAPAGSRLESR